MLTAIWMITMSSCFTLGRAVSLSLTLENPWTPRSQKAISRPCANLEPSYIFISSTWLSQGRRSLASATTKLQLTGWIKITNTQLHEIGRCRSSRDKFASKSRSYWWKWSTMVGKLSRVWWHHPPSWTNCSRGFGCPEVVMQVSFVIPMYPQLETYAQ